MTEPKSLPFARRRWTPLALAVAPILMLAACDQISGWLGGSGPAAPPTQAEAPAEPQPGEMPAVGGAVILPDSERADLLEVQPTRVVPGEILVGAPLDQALAETATLMGLTSGLVNRLRSNGEGALSSVDPQQLDELMQRAEALAGQRARDRARVVLERLGVNGEIDIQRGGVVTIDLTPEGAAPLGLTPGAAPPPSDTPTPGETTEAADPDLLGVVWEAGACPRTVDPNALETDLTLRTRCAIARLQSSRQFEFVEPNYVTDVEFDRLPTSQPRPQPAPQPAPQPTPQPAPQPQPTPPATTPPATPQPTGPAEASPIDADPNDPLLALQWHYRPRGTATGQSPGGAGFEQYWREARQVGSRRVRVAVIDTGLDLQHPDIRNSPNVGAGIDLISNPERAGDNDGVDSDANDVGDRCGTRPDSQHGTHVAGTIGAVTTNDNQGVAGGAWNVTVVPVRALGRCGGELEDIVNAIRWSAGLGPAISASGTELRNATPADIINMSLSIGAPCPAPMQAAIDAAVARGSVVVVAAGNRALPARSYAPANCNNVITVAAGDARGGLAFYSNFGPEVDVMAPGGDLFTDSDNDGRPDGVLSTLRTSANCLDPQTGQTQPSCFYGYLQGTSMATPHVSAALALLQAQTGVRGRALETAFFSRAIARYAGRPPLCEIDCARNANATPIPGQPGRCMRDCGQGMLDMGLAARTP